MAGFRRSRSAFSSVRIVSSVKGDSSRVPVELTHTKLNLRASDSEYLTADEYTPAHFAPTSGMWQRGIDGLDTEGQRSGQRPKGSHTRRGLHACGFRRYTHRTARHSTT